MIFKLLLKKDLQQLFRAREALLGTLSFAVLLVVLNSFSLRFSGIGQQDLEGIVAGLVWMHIVFCGIVFINQSFQTEIEEQAILGLILDGVLPHVLYAAKAVANLIFLSIVTSFLLLLHGLLSGIDLFGEFFSLWLIYTGGVVGFVALGTLFAGISTASRTRDIVLPILLVPALLPLSAAVTFVARSVFWNEILGFDNFWVQLVIGFDAISIVLGLILFEYVVKE